VSRCHFAVEERGIDGSVRAWIAELDRLSKEPTPHGHGTLSYDRYSFEAAGNAVSDISKRPPTRFISLVVHTGEGVVDRPSHRVRTILTKR